MKFQGIRPPVGQAALLPLLLALGGCTGTPPTREVDERIGTPIQAMCEKLSTAEAVSYRAKEFMDVFTEDGQLVQLDASFTVALQRPATLRVDADSGELKRSLWMHDGGVTAVDRVHNTYTRLSVPTDLDSALDDLADRFGLTFPGVDFLYSDPLSILMAQADQADYLGAGRVNGEKLHHLAFEAPGIEWALWLTDEDVPLPRSILLVETGTPGRPNYEATLTDWSFDKTGAIALDLPKDCREIKADEFFAKWEEQP